MNANDFSGKSQARLSIALYAAPLSALICSSASWLHYWLTGSVRLREFPREPVLAWTGLMAAAGLVLLGACCVTAFLSINRQNARKILYSALAVHAIMFTALPLFSTDLFSYLAYGQLAARGLNPHAVGPAALGQSPLLGMVGWVNTPSVYGPIADLLMSVAGHVGQWADSPVWIAGLCYKSIVGLFDITSLLIMYAVLGASDERYVLRGFALFALCPVLAWEVAGQAHNDGLVVCAAAVYVWASRRGKDSLGVVALALGALSKFVLAPTLALQLRVFARTGILRVVPYAALILAVAVVSYLPTWSGLATLNSWIQPMSHDDTFRQGTSLYTVLWKVLRVLHAPESAHAVSYLTYVWTGRLLVATLGASFLWRVRNSEDVAFASLIVLLALLSTSTSSAAWYLPWTLPFVAVQRETRWQVFILGLTVVCAPAHGPAPLWLLLPIGQVAGLVALCKWSVPKVFAAGPPTS